ncbi:FecR domain-containing protein [Paucibacter sp. R3-3]|uniref:FecR domain-containing protein n=1 Tax=Roseateles agri TaxID=3098619 RepID=A0ABU5DCS6_9BURK|nr:FecR domain-containing protein [Paucibacter sp. R3-3]MDY0744070.1 FecR domain-containing protein [Paucibacter sp. R3-3]
MTAACNTRQRRRASATIALAMAMGAAMLSMPAPSALAKPRAPAAAADADPAWSYHVQPGDNLFDLAAAYLKERTSWRELQKLNRVADPLRLPPGSTLKMPVRLLRREASVAQAVFVQGEVSLRHAGGSTPAPLRTGDELRSGDALVTGEQATLTLRFVDGSRLLVAPRSEVTVEELLVYGRSAVPAMRLQLQKGSADSKVQPSRERPADYQLKTPSLLLGVRGTEFRVQVSDDGRSARAEVLEGTVAGTPAGAAAATPMPAGYGLAATLGQAPSPLTKLLPAPALAGVPQKLERIPMTITWPALDGAGAYRAQVFDGQGNLLLDGRFESPRAQWADLPDGNYKLRLRGIDALGLEGLAAEQDVRLKARPEPPFASSPAPDARVYGDSAPLAWTRPVNAQSFRLQVGTDAGFQAPPVLERSGLSSTELGASLPPGQYFWRVASTAAGPDDGPWGDPQHFELRPVPPTPPLQPPAIDGDQLRFAWAAAPGAARYELQWAADAEFKTLLAEPRTEQPALVLPRPGHGVYYLRVRSVDELGYAGPYGTAQRVELPRPLWPWLLPLLLVPLAF